MTEFMLSDACRLGLMPDDGIAKILADKTRHRGTGSGIPRCELYLRVADTVCRMISAVCCALPAVVTHMRIPGAGKTV